MLGESPTLAGGLVAVGTLLVLEFGFTRVRRSAGILPGARRVTGAVVMVGRHVVERDGKLSVLQAGTKVDRRILTGVRGLDRLPASLLED